MQACIEHCFDCHKTCLSELSLHCLEMGGAHVEPHHFRLMMDCAQICGVAADFMLCGSKHHPHICAECAECADICRDCAASCENIEGMETCAAKCRKCETTCRQMAQMA